MQVPFQLADMAARVGVEQEFVGVKAVALLRLIGAVDAVAVGLAGADAFDPAVKHLIGIFGQSIRSVSVSPASNRHTSTFVACAENREKLTPLPSQVAPRGRGSPSRIRFVEIAVTSTLMMEWYMYRSHVSLRIGRTS